MTVAQINTTAAGVALQEFGKANLTPIAMKEPTVSHKTLGVWMTMDGNSADHVKVMSQRSNNMANIVATSGLYPYQADTAIRMYYTPSMGYSLPAIVISEKILDRIQYKAMESFTPALGYNKGFPRDILFGPEEFGGEAIPHLYTEARLQQLEIFLMHIRAKSTLGTLMMIDLNWIQLHLGLSTPLFEYDKEITHMSNWFISLHQFLREINGKITIKDTYTPTIARKGDRCIMDVITCSNCDISKNQLRMVYNWRLYFQVELLSDLTNAIGDRIMDVYLTYPTEPNIQLLYPDRVSKLQWPSQPPPLSKESFKIWTKCLRRCFPVIGKKLKITLGDWIQSPSIMQSQWQYYINPSYTTLIQVTGNTFQQFCFVTSSTIRTRSFSMDHSTIIDELPANCFPVTTTIRANIITAHHNKCQICIAQENIPATGMDIQETICAASDWKRHILQHFRIYDIEVFQKCLQDSADVTSLLIVTDGGLKDGIGSFGVSIATPRLELCRLESPAPGNEALLTPFRAEAYGMLAGISFLHEFVRSHNIVLPPRRKVLLYCDNMALVTWISLLLEDISYPRMFLKSEVDVIIQIKQEIHDMRNHNVIFEISWVKGHQDDTTPYNELPRPAQLNVDTDLYATNYLLHGHQHPYHELPSNCASLYIDDCIITRDIKSIIRSASRSPALQAYMLAKFDWHHSVPETIWWQVHGSTIHTFPRNDRRRIRKFIFRWLPTCHRLNMYDKTVRPGCPTCSNAIETHDHLLLCPCIKRSRIKVTSFDNLYKFLSNEKYTPKLVGQILYNNILSTCSPFAPPSIPDIPDSQAQQAYNDQQLIGWPQLLRGRLSIKWGNIIATQLHNNRVSEKEMSALDWGRQFVRLGFQLMLQIWNTRNAEGHQSNPNHESVLSRQRIMDKIEALQLSNPPVRCCDRDFVYKPLEPLQSYSLSNLLSWHRCVVQIVKNQKRYIQRQPDIRESFRPVNMMILTNSDDEHQILTTDTPANISIITNSSQPSSQLTDAATNPSPPARSGMLQHHAETSVETESSRYWTQNQIPQYRHQDIESPRNDEANQIMATESQNAEVLAMSDSREQQFSDVPRYSSPSSRDYSTTNSPLV